MADGNLISRASLLAGIAELKESPWYNFGKVDGTSPEGVEAIWHYGYLQRKDAVEIIEDICIKKEPAVLANSGWISVDDKLPPTEQDVLIAVDSGIGRKYITAIGFYEDGKRFARDSACNWDIDCFDMMYNENADDWIIPQGWYEGVMFGEEFTEITGKVVYWQPLPEPPKEDKDG